MCFDKSNQMDTPVILRCVPSSTLKDKRLLVTGGSGFLGSHLLEDLHHSGCRNVMAPRRAECDLMDPLAIRRYLRAKRPQVIIHLAAQVGGIGANQKHPGTFLYRNLMMGAHLIEEARRFGVEKFVCIGTICSYPKHTPVPFREIDFWNGYPEETNAPYGIAKKLLSVQIDAYRQEFGFQGINLLLVNLYGPRDNFDAESSHVIPALIRKCLEAKANGNREMVVWGTGHPTREFLYVEDAARAIVLATEQLESPAPLNIGSGTEITIADLAHLIARKTGFAGAIRFDASRPDGQPRRCLDVSRAADLIGFRARVSLEEGLERTICWYESSRQEVRQAA